LGNLRKGEFRYTACRLPVGRLFYQGIAAHAGKVEALKKSTFGTIFQQGLFFFCCQKGNFQRIDLCLVDLHQC
jgi:hypothetical protein